MNAYPDDHDMPAPKISSTEPSITTSITPERSEPMQDLATPTSPEESSMLDAFRGGSPVPVGNPDAAAAAEDMNDAITSAADTSVKEVGRESAVYGRGRGSWLR